MNYPLQPGQLVTDEDGYYGIVTAHKPGSVLADVFLSNGLQTVVIASTLRPLGLKADGDALPPACFLEILHYHPRLEK